MVGCISCNEDHANVLSRVLPGKTKFVIHFSFRKLDLSATGI